MANDESIVEEMDRREYRRKRRIRNRILSFVVLALVLAGLVVGGVIGVRKLLSAFGEKKYADELQKQMDELQGEGEEPPVVEAPDQSVEQAPPQEEPNYIDEIVNSCISEMPIEDKVAGLFMITPEALTGTETVVRAGDTTKAKLGERPVGLVYSAKNIQSAEQLTEMLSNTRNWSKYPIFLGIEEEGGTISPVAEKGLGENVGSMADIGAAGDPGRAREAGALIGGYLSGLGFNMDFAPVADIVAEGNTVIGNRSFGPDAVQAASMVSAAVEGLQSAKVSACLKYFPGLGDTLDDISAGMANSEKTLEELQANDFTVYQAGIGAGADFVMAGHISMEKVTGDNTPASISGIMITDILRGQMYFEGVIITDALNMKAISDFYGADEAAVMAILAGCDMLLMPEDFEKAYEGVLEAVRNGYISEERINDSLRRIYRIKYADRIEE